MKTVLIVLAAVLLSPAWAKDEKKGSKDGKTTIDFEGDVVEGMNRMPLDSASSVAEANDGAEKSHLYRRTKKFKDENRELAREILETY